MFKNILVLFCLLSSFSARAVFLPPVDSLTVAGQALVNQPKIVYLYCELDNTNSYCTMRDLSNPIAGFVVPGGKTLYIYAMEASQNSSVAGQILTFGTCTSDLGYHSAGPIVGGVDFYGAASTNAGGNFAPVSATANVLGSKAVGFVASTGKYVCAKNVTGSGTGYIWAYGYLK